MAADEPFDADAADLLGAGANHPQLDVVREIACQPFAAREHRRDRRGVVVRTRGWRRLRPL
jgi:hypothetical protein